MSYRNERFAKKFLPLSAIGDRTDRSFAASDRGAGVGRIVADIDRTPSDICREERNWNENRVRKFHAAEMRLRRAGMGFLVPTFALICRNGLRRDESIAAIAASGRIDWTAARRLYFAHREKIEKFFLAQ